MAINTKCVACGRRFKQDEKVIRVDSYVENERRGDFVTNVDKDFIHAHHMVTMVRVLPNLLRNLTIGEEREET